MATASSVLVSLDLPLNLDWFFRCFFFAEEFWEVSELLDAVSVVNVVEVLVELLSELAGS